MSSSGLSARSSDDAPSRRDLLLTVVVFVFQLPFAETIFWGWLVAGFLAFALAVGPLAASPIGARVGARFRAIGYAGRGLVIVSFAVVVWTALATLTLPDGLVTSLAAGGTLGVLAVAILESATN